MRPALVLFAAALATSAQTFEVASLKPAPNRAGEAAFMKFSDTTGRLAYSNVTPRILISMAYGFSDNKMSAGPKWIEDTRWDLSAVFPPETTKDQVHAMLAALLVDRFALVTHRVTKEMPAFGLAVSRGGAKLKPSPPDKTGGIYTLAGEIVGPQLPLSVLAEMLAIKIGRPVVDMTGLKGNFDIDLKWTPDRVSEDFTKDAPGESIYAALTDQLGLQLRSRTAAVEFLVIDGASQPAPEN